VESIAVMLIVELHTKRGTRGQDEYEEDGEAIDHDCVVARRREHEAFARFASYQ